MENKKPRIRKKARLIPNKCIACGARCQMSCPKDAIEMNEKGEPIVDIEKCIGCNKCAKICPAEAMEMFQPQALGDAGSSAEEDTETEPEEEASELSNWRGVWVLVEHMEGKAHPVSWELLGIGKTLARDLDVELAAVILGSDVQHLSTEAFGHGADKVYLIDDPVLKYYRVSPYLRGVVTLVKKYQPEIILIGATGLGRDLAGSIATVLNTGLTADCTGLSIDRKKRLLEQTRPAFGGNIMATILTENARPQMATVRPRVMPMPAFIQGRQAELILETIDMKEEEVTTKIIEIASIRCETIIDITSYDILVSGGRGMMTPDNFKMLDELAQLLGGAVCGTRGAADAGMITHDRQVGQTGKTVRPKLYIACAVSGAIQHIVGMQNSEYIIAINKDKNAPIFETAHLGIVGDVFDLLPDLIQAIRPRVEPLVCNT
jgi:electron transfer flavoprotein alpha subunit